MRGRALQGWAEASRRIVQGPTVRRPGIGPTVSFRVTTSPGVNPLPAPHRSSVNQPTDPRCPSSKFQGPHFHPNCCRHPDARPDCRSLSCALPRLRRPFSSCQGPALSPSPLGVLARDPSSLPPHSVPVRVPPPGRLPGPPPEASGARGEPAESTPCAPCSGASLWVIRLSFIHSFIRRLVADRAGLNSWLPKDSLCPQANDFHSPGRPQFPSLQNGISTSPAWTQPSVGSVLRTVVSAPPRAHPKITFPSGVPERCRLPGTRAL